MRLHKFCRLSTRELLCVGSLVFNPSKSNISGFTLYPNLRLPKWDESVQTNEPDVLGVFFFYPKIRTLDIETICIIDYSQQP